ncbi:MAG: OmpA family protein [Bacteroidetes bacterium]|nr:OmpA family protein [Bacteroidota bacterium]
MKTRSFLLILILWAILSSPVAGQIKNARKEISLFNYSNAITILKKALDKKKCPAEIKREATILLADCYRRQNDVPNAREWYSKAVKFADIDPLNYYYYAQALRSSGDYAEAKQMFLHYSVSVKQDRQGQLLAAYCDSAVKWQNRPPDREIRNPRILNSAQSDFGAVTFEKEILFASDRIVATRQDRMYGWTGYNYLHLFSASPIDPSNYYGDFSKPSEAGNPFNEAWHVGPVSFNKTFDEVFINETSLSKDKGRKDPGRIRTHMLKLFSSVKKDGNWSKPEPFFYNSDDYSVGHPALTPDGNTLYFVSDMYGGYGGTDIYMSTRENSMWSPPVNLGPVINTAGNEMFPYISLNGDLYFASDALPGFGGLDIFVSNNINGKWTTPKNMGSPLNSSYDDFALTVAPDNVSGFFSSNRPGGEGNDDIYSFRKIPVKKVVPPQQAFVTGCVKNKTTLTPIPNAVVFFIDNKHDTALIIRTNANGCFTTPVDKHRSYITKAMQTGYISDCLSFSFDTLDNKYDLTLPRDLLLDQLEVNKIFRLDNIYYDFDKWKIRKDAEPPLNDLVLILRENPVVTVELGSHTDCRGSDEYNQKLSQRRAESAVKYIIHNGIEVTRITAKGYGETRLINKCECLKCTSAEHQMNRRTEFKILSVTNNQPESSFDLNLFHTGDFINIKTLPEDFFRICGKK